jgi:hypothetical protein
MRVYVASKFENKEEVRRVMEMLKDKGHRISYDWTDEDGAGKTGNDLAIYLRRCALEDRHGVLNAEALLLINYPNGCGMFSELGMALALNWITPNAVRILVVDRDRGPDNIFFYLKEVEHYATVEDAVRSLR